MAEFIGSSLGKYDILEELGRGGFGAVYRVRNRDLDREEALKVLGQHRQWDPTFVRRFQREARIAARLRHPHIVTIYEVGEAEGAHYLSMAYLPGRTLAQLVASEGALPQARVARLLAQVAEALDYAHAQGLIHRDVKPSNIMVGPADDVTLMDFGLVKAADHSELSQELYSSGAGFTTAAAAMGTPEYMAPELAEPNGPSEDYRADIYSLGVVAYQVLTGHLPFAAPTPVAVLRAHIDLVPPPLTQWVASLPAPVNAAVLRALAKNPAERYPSAGGFAAALTEAARQAEAERTRTERVAALYAQAQEALGAKNWAAALAACGQVMALDANYRDAGALFDQANQGLVRQREWEAQQEEMAEQYERGTARLAEGKWNEAIALLKPLATGDQVFRDADRKLAEAQAAQQAEAAQRQERIAQLYEKALAAYRRAKDHVAEIVVLQPDWRDPSGELNHLITAAAAEAGGRSERSEAHRPAPEPKEIAKKAGILLRAKEALSAGTGAAATILWIYLPLAVLALTLVIANLLPRIWSAPVVAQGVVAFGLVLGAVGTLSALATANVAQGRRLIGFLLTSLIVWTATGALAALISFRTLGDLRFASREGWPLIRLLRQYGPTPTLIDLLAWSAIATPIQSWLLRRSQVGDHSPAAALAIAAGSTLTYMVLPFTLGWLLLQGKAPTGVVVFIVLLILVLAGGLGLLLRLRRIDSNLQRARADTSRQSRRR